MSARHGTTRRTFIGAAAAATGTPAMQARAQGAVEQRTAIVTCFSLGTWHSLFSTILPAAIAAPITASLGLLAARMLIRRRFAG